MSFLPQQKKSAEEIAKLRESLGISGHAPGEGGGTAEASQPEPTPVLQESSASLIEPLPLADAHSHKQSRSLKRVERIPILPVVEFNPEEFPEIEEPVTAPAKHVPKPVRSLRKSEQVPLVAIDPPPPDSTLPIHRHSDKELHEIRRQEALAMLAPAVHPQSLTAHNVLIVPGYLFALAGAICYYYYDLEIQYTSCCVLASLLVATFIFVRKPLSRHHAAFISVAALFVIVFGAIHYFPNLQYGT